MTTLNSKLLKELINYDPDTGIFTWRLRKIRSTHKRFDLSWNTRYANKKAGVISCSGGNNVSYITIGINSIKYQSHRLAFLYMTGEFPPSCVDHKDRNGLNNKWNNLRKANKTQNLANSKIRSDNTSGFRGVHFCKRDKRYQAYINFKNKRKNLGSYDTAEAAHNAYIEAAENQFGEFARPK